MPNFMDKGKDKAIDLQNFGLRSDLYNKKNIKVSIRRRQHLNIRLVFFLSSVPTSGFQGPMWVKNDVLQIRKRKS